ncbi:unnamed protein product, partial [Didymodactylos carnosus]
IHAASLLEIEQLERMKHRRVNNIAWQQQSFQKCLNEKHVKWKAHDRAFRLKLKRDLTIPLATARGIRFLKTSDTNDDISKFSKTLSPDDIDDTILIERLAKSNSANPKILNTGSKSVQMSNTATPMFSSTPHTNLKGRFANSQSAGVIPRNKRLPSISTTTRTLLPNRLKLSKHRNKASRFENLSGTDQTEDDIDFGTLLMRILNHIAATPDLKQRLDHPVIRAIRARDRKTARTQDERFSHLMQTLATATTEDANNNADSDSDN